MATGAYADPDIPFRDPLLGRKLLAGLRQRAERLAERLDRPVRFMEVCGTHTVQLFRSGVRDLLPPELAHVSGPGCPVCVTHGRELAALAALAARPEVVLASFGDMLRVPGPGGLSLAHARARGAAVVTVYSPLDALHLAAERPDRLVVFAAAGFETTAPASAAAVLMARARGLDNFCLFCCHKRVPPALRLLLTEERHGGEHGLDALLLPGHVSTVLGTEPFAFIPEEFGLPAVVAGFEAADLIAALELLLDMLLDGRPRLINAYKRAVAEDGNARAREVTERVFEPADAAWRGLGVIPGGGLRLRAPFAAFDVMARLELELPPGELPPDEPPACGCGDVLRGRIRPPECPLFGTTCTPGSPVGPCMVSGEGGCAAWYVYGQRRRPYVSLPCCRKGNFRLFL